MTDLSNLLQQGHTWLFIPSAVLLGALHGLEPGHSKTMMVAFIIAIRGTLAQAVLLGLSAAISHSAVVWLVAMAGLYFGHHWNVETTEPCFQIASAVLIIAIATWMLWRTWRHQQLACKHSHHHDHHYENAIQPDTYQDPHELAHARDIRRRFAHREVTTGQIVLFGLTGGLLPCPASITVLLLCLQLKKLALGTVLVLCFSIGLALTLVSSGVLAALSVKHALQHWDGFGELARKAPYCSSVLIILIGFYVGYQGVHELMQRHLS